MSLNWTYVIVVLNSMPGDAVDLEGRGSKVRQKSVRAFSAEEVDGVFTRFRKGNMR